MLVNDNEASRRMLEQCYKRNKTVVNPIIEWTDKDVWDFIKTENVPYCGLYDFGFTRLGCIGCPNARKKGREIEFKMWPKYKASYLRAFCKMLERIKEKQKIDFLWRIGTTAQDVFNWWMEYDVLPGQINMFEEENE